MLLSYNSSRLVNPYPLFQKKSIHVSIDSSKTNSALAVGDSNFNLIGYIEMNGANDGTSKEDTLRLCYNERKALQVLFQGADVLSMGIEDIITKKDGSGSGIDYHLSRFKITAVFMSFITYFMDKYNLEPILINNQEWKSSVLPKELNTRDVHKGSREFIASIHPRFSNITDDASDAICMLMFMKKKFKDLAVTKIMLAELPRHEYVYKLLSGNYDFKSDVYKFEANHEIGLVENMNVVSNTIDDNAIGVFRWNVNDLSLSDIYTYVYGKHDLMEKEVIVCVQNKGGKS